MRTKVRFTAFFLHFHSMLYAKMFHGYDIMKHLNIDHWLRLNCSRSA